MLQKELKDKRRLFNCNKSQIHTNAKYLGAGANKLRGGSLFSELMPKNVA